jgi:hypothetical protein
MRKSDEENARSRALLKLAQIYPLTSKNAVMCGAVWCSAVLDCIVSQSRARFYSLISHRKRLQIHKLLSSLFKRYFSMFIFPQISSIISSNSFSSSCSFSYYCRRQSGFLARTPPYSRRPQNSRYPSQILLTWTNSNIRHSGKPC